MIDILSIDSAEPKYTLSYVDDFYMYCEMEDRTIMIQHMDETNIQFDTKFKATGNCTSYTKILHYMDYKTFKDLDYKLDKIKHIIELELSTCIFNHVDETMIKVINKDFGSYSHLNFYKNTSSITVDTHVHFFSLKTMRYKNKEDAVPDEDVKTYLFDSAKKQVYVKSKNKKHSLLDIFKSSRFSTCKIEIYESLTTDAFKVMIDNSLMGTTVCYDNETLTIYDNTFGDVVCFKEPEIIIAALSDLMLEVIISDPSTLMIDYSKEYDIDLETMSSDQLKTIVMADY